MIKKITLASVFASLLAVPTVLFAAEGAVYSFTLIPENIESLLELINLVIAMLAAFYAVKLAALSQGGELEKTWNKMALCAVLFAVLEIFGSLKMLGLVSIEGIGDVIEFLFVSVLLIAVFTTRKSLLKKVLGR